MHGNGETVTFVCPAIRLIVSTRNSYESSLFSTSFFPDSSVAFIYACISSKVNQLTDIRSVHNEFFMNEFRCLSDLESSGPY